MGTTPPQIPASQYERSQSAQYRVVVDARLRRQAAAIEGNSGGGASVGESSVDSSSSFVKKKRSKLGQVTFVFVGLVGP